MLLGGVLGGVIAGAAAASAASIVAKRNRERDATVAAAADGAATRGVATARSSTSMTREEVQYDRWCMYEYSSIIVGRQYNSSSSCVFFCVSVLHAFLPAGEYEYFTLIDESVVPFGCFATIYTTEWRIFLLSCLCRNF